MKQILSLHSILTLVLSTAAFAESGSKEITVEGNACCAKYVLKETDACQSVISAEKDGRKTICYLADNEDAKAIDEKSFTRAKPAIATGVCVKTGGKLQFATMKAEAN